MAVTKRLRFEIFRRDNHACRYCGASAPDAKLTIDHVIPASLGGTDEPANLVTACEDCNSGKGSSSPDAPVVEDVTQDALRWAAARERAEAMLAAEREKREDYIDRFAAVWTAEAPAFAEIPDNAEASITRFYEAGLPIEELLDAARVAFAATHVYQRRRFNYMCGVAWRKVERLSAMTQELAAAEDSDV